MTMFGDQWNNQPSFQQPAPPDRHREMSDFILNYADKYLSTLFDRGDIDFNLGKEIKSAFLQHVAPLANWFLTWINNINHGDSRIPAEFFNTECNKILNPITIQAISNRRSSSTVGFQQLNYQQQQPLNLRQPQSTWTPTEPINQLRTTTMDNPPASAFPGTSQPQVIIQPSGPVEVITQNNAPVGFVNRTGINPTSRSTKCGDISITSIKTHDKIVAQKIDPRSKTTVDDEADFVNYIDVECHIREPSIRRVIDNFIRTNPSLCSERYVINIKFKRFVLKRGISCGMGDSPVIDISSLSNEDLSVGDQIYDVLNSIANTKSAAVSDVLGKLLIREFNDNIRKRIRLTSAIRRYLDVAGYNDIMTMIDAANTREHEFAIQPEYLARILESFKESVKVILTNETRRGYYDIRDIAKDLIVDPNFVIRDNNLLERAGNFNDDNFLAAIASRYTAFSYDGTVVVTNFIPAGMEEALNDGPIIVEERKASNHIEALLTSVWYGDSTTILMRQAGHEILVKGGTCMDSNAAVLYMDDIKNLDLPDNF